MKRKFHLLLAAVCCSAAPFAAADGVQGGYVQGDIGSANVRIEDGTLLGERSAFSESGFMPRVSAGYDFGDVRVAGDYTHYPTVRQSARQGSDRADVKFNIRSVGASVVYDIPTGSALSPYVGARLSVNRISGEAEAQVGGTTFSMRGSDTKVGVGVLAGVGYQIDNNLSIDGGYRYNRLTSDLKTHEVSAGLRYTFQ